MAALRPPHGLCGTIRQQPLGPPLVRGRVTPPLPFGSSCNGSHLSGNTKHETRRKKASLGLGWEHETPNTQQITLDPRPETLNTQQETRGTQHQTGNKQQGTKDTKHEARSTKYEARSTMHETVDPQHRFCNKEHETRNRQHGTRSTKQEATGCQTTT